MARGRSVRDSVVWAIIIGGHALLIIVFTSSKWRVQTGESGAIEVIPLDEPRSEAAALAPVPEPVLASIPPEIDPNSTAITLPPEEEPQGPGSNTIDWKLEAERSAHIVVTEQGSKRAPRKLGEHPPSPFREKPKPKEFPWDPEPPKAGFAGGFIPTCASASAASWALASLGAT